MKGFVLGLAAEGRKLWQRLSVAQRLSLIGIGAAAALGLAWMAFEAQAPDVRRPVSADSADGEAGAGRPAPAGSEEDALLDNWLFNGNELFSGRLLHGERLEEIKRRRVRRTISWMTSIQGAGLEVDRPPQTFPRTREADGSATVMLFLAPGVERLSPREARVVRQIIHGAYGLRPDVVSLTDNMGNSYGAEEDDILAVREGDDRYLANLERDITELICGLFAAHEFELVVRSLPRSPAGPGGRSPSAAGGLMIPGGRQTVDLSSPCELDGPGGSHEAQGVNVVVTFDRDAVSRLLGSDDSRQAADGFPTIDEFKAGQKQLIESLLFPHRSHVSVFVQPRTKHEPLLTADSGGAATGTATAARQGESGPRKWGVWRDWIEGRWPFLAMVGGVLVVVLIAGTAVRRAWVLSSREPSRRRGGGAAGAIPPRMAARSNGGASAQIAWRLFPGRGAPPSDLRTGTNGQDSLLSATDRMSEWVQERPRTAASVLRVWLAQPETVSVSEISREGGPS